mgnify:CR=1 FL=1
MNLKKVLCAALSTVTAVSLLASCGGKGKMQMDKAELTGPKAYDEQIELKIPVYDRGMQGQADVDNNYWTDYVQKNFGDKYNIKMTFVPVTRKEDVTVFNELLAAGEEPDILFSYDYPTMISYYSRGAFQPIDEDEVLSSLRVDKATYETTGTIKTITETTTVTDVINTKIAQLPSTGGMGTYLFTIIGVVVMAGAAGAFFISRRKGSEE